MTSWSPGFTVTTSLQRGEGNYDRQQEKGRAIQTLLHLVFLYSIGNSLVEVVSTAIVVSDLFITIITYISHIQCHHCVYSYVHLLALSIGLHNFISCMFALRYSWWRTDTKVANFEWDVEPRFMRRCAGAGAGKAQNNIGCFSIKSLTCNFCFPPPPLDHFEAQVMHWLLSLKKH